MNNLFLAGAQSGAGSNNMFMIISIIILGAIMYFGMIRPQKKQQQKRMEMMDQLKKGDRVVLVDGLHAKIDSINDRDQTVVVDADGIYLTFSRMAIRQILPSQETKQVEESPKSEENKPAETEAKETKSEGEQAPAEEAEVKLEEKTNESDSDEK